MDTISISRFKATCLAMLDQVSKTNRPLVVTRRGIPIAKVVPPDKEHSNHSSFGIMCEGTAEAEDALAPLPVVDWEALT